MRKFNFSAFTAFIIFTSVCIGTGVDAHCQAKAEITTIGAILPLSGQLASAGDAARNGMELALESLPADQRANFRIVYEDDGFVPKNTVTALNKLLSIDKVSVVVGFGSATGNAISKACEDHGVTFVSVSSDPAVSAGRRHVFTLWVTPEAESKVLNPEMHKRGYSRIARITSIHDGAFAARSAYDLENAGKVKTILDEEYSLEQKDFRAYLAKLKRLGDFDAFLPLLFPEQLALFAKQARELGFTQPFFGYELFEDEQAVKLSNGALVGSWYSTYDDGDATFLEQYRAKFPGSGTLGAANGADAVRLIAAARQSGRLRSSQFSEFLHGLKNFSGSLGRYSATGDNRFTLPATLKVVTKDGFKKLY